MLNVLNQFGLDGKDIQVVGSFGDRGAEQPSKAVLLSDWNDVPQETQDALTDLGYALAWCDEYVISHEHNKAYRSEPEHAFWKPSYYMTDYGDLLTIDDSTEQIIDAVLFDGGSCLNGVLPHWVTDSDLKELGFKDVGYSPNSYQLYGRLEGLVDRYDLVVRHYQLDGSYTLFGRAR